jgi:nicotinate-nucleotide adenylyltransferase
MKIALYGGSFNPIHKAHEQTIQMLSAEFDLVIVVPAKKHAFKGDINAVSDHHRLNLITTCIKNISNVVVSNFELVESQTGFMIETVLFLKEKYKHAFISIVIGADNLVRFTEWKSWQQLLTAAELYVVPRPNAVIEIPQGLNRFSSRIHFAVQSELPISSTEIRKRLLAGESIEHLVSEDVSAYIYKNNVYQNEK